MRLLTRVPLSIFALSAAMLLTACDSSTTPAAKTVSTIAVSPSTASLIIGGTQALSVTATYSDASTGALTTGVTYTSSSTAVATASGDGLVTAVGAGMATITASASGKTATATITVAAPAPTVTSIALTPTAISLAPAATQQLTVTGTFSNATTSALTTGVTFVSSATNVATISGTGLITAVAAGTTTITATHTASTRTANVTVTVVAPATGATVFSDVYPAGVSFADFGGAANAVTIDATNPNNGRSSIRAVITANGSAYSGGAFVAATPRNLSAFNALTFWAKASVARSTLKVGIGNNASALNPMNAEAIGIPLTTTFQKFVIPIPNPAKFNAADGLFHFADGPNNYTVWFNDIQYETLPASQIGAPTGATVAWPTINAPIGAPFTINPGPNTVSYATPVLPNGGKLTDVAWRWFTLTSSNPAVATVSVDGVVTGVSAGTANITATLGGITLPSSASVTVTAPLAAPTTIAPAPTALAANVISLFTTAYTNRAVETWRTSWSFGGNELVDPFVVAGRNIKKYTLFNFVGVEYGVATPANAVDATTMTHFHVDVWSPNPSSNLEIQLVNDAGGTAAIGKFQAGAVAANTWVQLDIPLANFTGLTTRPKLNQLLFVAAGPSVLYIDNVYFRR